MQPLQALEHPKFHEMIAVAARAPKDEGVNIPGRKATRSHIVKLFDTHMKDLRERLSVCISFSLRILCSISSAYRVTARAILASPCDAWQASNCDAYFAVTGHWNETGADGVWRRENHLLGFVQLNSKHDGVALGRALFKIVRRLGFGHKVRQILCDSHSIFASSLTRVHI